MTKSTVEVLRDAKALLETKGWTQGTYARDDAGLPADPEGPSAVCFCAMGALWQVNPMCDPATAEAERALYLAAFPNRAPASGSFGLDFNDTEGRTLSEVLAKFDEAIAAEELKASEVPA